MIKNVKVKVFLSLSFALVLVMMTVLGSCALFFTQRLAGQNIQFYDEPHTIQLEVAEIRRLVSDVGSWIRRAFIYMDPQKTRETTAAVQADIAAMNQSIDLVKERFSGDQAVLARADEQMGVWLTEIETLRALMEAQDYSRTTQEFAGSYLPIEGEFNNRLIAISDQAEDISTGFYESAQRSQRISGVAVTVMLLFTLAGALVLCVVIIRSITIPLKRVMTAADSMSRGDLKFDIGFAGKNEFGRLAQSIQRTAEVLSTYVSDIDRVLGEISEDDLTAAVDLDYIGDFAPIRQSLEKIVRSLNRALSGIGQSAAQVEGGAGQVASSSEILSQGAAEQASAVETLSSNIGEISEQVTQNAAYTGEARTLVDEVGVRLEQGNRQMEEMLEAMKEINRASDQIARVIKTIEDISFQTNILALNASVEAARAGAAGKGFAVVADEVRSLAAKSAEAAKGSAQLIEASIRAVENGTHIADSTAQTIGAIVEQARDITRMMAKIADSSNAQAQSVQRVRGGIEQISQVVQTNSATAEQSAAASEELSGQAKIMHGLVGRFRLREKEGELYQPQALPGS